MGYFSNGTEGMIYEDTYCVKCVNYRDLDDGRSEGCPVWDAHHLFDMKGDTGEVLDFFIERNGIKNEQCKMFLNTEVSS